MMLVKHVIELFFVLKVRIEDISHKLFAIYFLINNFNYLMESWLNIVARYVKPILRLVYANKSCK